VRSARETWLREVLATRAWALRRTAFLLTGDWSSADELLTAALARTSSSRRLRHGEIDLTIRCAMVRSLPKRPVVITVDADVDPVLADLQSVPRLERGIVVLCRADGLLLDDVVTGVRATTKQVQRARVVAERLATVDLLALADRAPTAPEDRLSLVESRVRHTRGRYGTPAVAASVVVVLAASVTSAVVRRRDIAHELRVNGRAVASSVLVDAFRRTAEAKTARITLHQQFGGDTEDVEIEVDLEHDVVHARATNSSFESFTVGDASYQPIPSDARDELGIPAAKKYIATTERSTPLRAATVGRLLDRVAGVLVDTRSFPSVDIDGQLAAHYRARIRAEGDVPDFIDVYVVAGLIRRVQLHDDGVEQERDPDAEDRCVRESTDQIRCTEASAEPSPSATSAPNPGLRIELTLDIRELGTHVTVFRPDPAEVLTEDDLAELERVAELRRQCRFLEDEVFLPPSDDEPTLEDLRAQCKTLPPRPGGQPGINVAG
jgi:hypothetical protein